MTSTLADLDMADVPQPVAELRAVDSEELQQVLGELHDDLRLILLMFYFEELSYKQICRRTRDSHRHRDEPALPSQTKVTGAAECGRGERES